MNKYIVVLPVLLACLVMPAFAEDVAEVRVSVVERYLSRWAVDLLIQMQSW